MLGDCSPPPTPLVSGLPCCGALCLVCWWEKALHVRSSDPAGGQGWWRSGRGRCDEKGQAPPFGAECLHPPSRRDQPGEPGALGQCCRPSMPRAGTGLSRAGLGDLASMSGSLQGAHLLQKAGGRKGSDNSISHSRADSVELPNLSPPGPPKPCAIFCQTFSCHPATSCAEGKGPGLLELPDGESTGKFLEASSLLTTQSPSSALWP